MQICGVAIWPSSSGKSPVSIGVLTKLEKGTSVKSLQGAIMQLTVSAAADAKELLVSILRYTFATVALVLAVSTLSGCSTYPKTSDSAYMTYHHDHK